jgi:hypothetical protein
MAASRDSSLGHKRRSVSADEEEKLKQFQVTRVHLQHTLGQGKQVIMSR